MSSVFDEYFSEEEVVEKPNTKGAQATPFDEYFAEENITEKAEPLIQRGLKKAGRYASQALTGAAQMAAFPFDVSAIIAKKVGVKSAPVEFRQNLHEDLQDLLAQKSSGDWKPEDQERYDFLLDLIKNPDKAQEFLPKEEEVPSFDVGSLIEKGAKEFGVDLEPKGVDEMASRWYGFIKNPTKAAEALQNPKNLGKIKDLAKALLPSGKEAARSVGAASALQYAAEAEFGPIGTMAALLIGDMAPTLAFSGAKGALKTLGKAGQEGISRPGKATAARATANFAKMFNKAEKNELQKSLIKEFRDAGIQADVGTITGNNAIEWIQSTLAQSGLTGAPLERLKKDITKNVLSEYKGLAQELGESFFESKYEAGQALKEGLKEARDLDLNKARELYNTAKEAGGEAEIWSGNVGSLVKEIEAELTPGAFKSAEQRAVINVLQDLKKDLFAPSGDIKSTSVKELINNKIALNDAINYEVQGGTKQLLKRVVKEIDTALDAHGKDNPTFGKNWKEANKKFAAHAKLFRGKVLNEALKTQDPSKIFEKMNTPNGIREIKKALSTTPEGRQIFKELSRTKLEEVVGQHMVDSTTEQLNHGKFSKLLQKGQNRQIIKELLGRDAFQRLEKLQTASGRIANTAQKFLNTSRSGVHATDLAFAGALMKSAGSLLTGNAWPLIKTTGTLVGTKKIAKLMADPEFIRLVEDAMLESTRGSQQSFIDSGLRLAARAKEIDKSLAGAATVAKPQEQ